MSVAELLAQNERLSLTPTNRIKCSITGHEMPCKYDVVAAHLNGSKFRKASQWYNHNYDAYLPYIIPHKSDTKKLYCTLTQQTLNRIPQVVEKHVQGKRFMRLKREHEEKQAARQTGATESTEQIVSDEEPEFWMPEEEAEALEQTRRAKVQSDAMATSEDDEEEEEEDDIDEDDDGNNFSDIDMENDEDENGNLTWVITAARKTKHEKKTSAIYTDLPSRNAKKSIPLPLSSTTDSGAASGDRKPSKETKPGHKKLGKGSAASTVRGNTSSKGAGDVIGRDRDDATIQQVAASKSQKRSLHGSEATTTAATKKTKVKR